LTSRPFRLLAGLLRTSILLGSLGPLGAHDFWIEPSRHQVQPGMGVALRLRVGTGFQGEGVPRNPLLLQRFALAGPVREIPATGAEGADPAGLARVEAPGLHWAVYQSTYSSVELEGAKFEAYLAEEGLDAVAAARRKRHETGKPVRERFLRCAKALVDAGGEGRGFDRVLGLDLELVPESDPRKADSDLRLRLLYRGRPLPGALVQLQRKGSLPAVQARTDAAGRVRLPCRGAGLWLAKAVHAVRSEDPAADWQSAWASLTFEAR
jgi:uncharacterized GH25 family protein